MDLGPSVGGGSGRVFERSELIHGVTDPNGNFREIPKDAIDAAVEATQLDAFEIDSFVPLKDVPFERALKSYFLAPQKGKGSTASAKSMALLHKALVKTKRAGVLKIVPKSRQALAPPTSGEGWPVRHDAHVERGLDAGRRGERAG